MMLRGHPEYRAEISKFMDEVEKLKGAVDHGEGDANRKAEQEQTA